MSSKRKGEKEGEKGEREREREEREAHKFECPVVVRSILPSSRACSRVERVHIEKKKKEKREGEKEKSE